MIERQTDLNIELKKLQDMLDDNEDATRLRVLAIS